MKRLGVFSRILFILFFIGFLCPLGFAQDETLTITTYYPSPYGVYRNLRLHPATAEPSCASADDEGVMYYDSNSDTVRVCVADADAEDGYDLYDIGGIQAGFWTQTDTNLYPNDTGWNVGIGTNAPPAKLTVQGNADVVQLIIQANAEQSNTNPLVQLRQSDGAAISSFHSDHNTNTFLGLDAGRANAVKLTGTWEGVRNTFVGASAGDSNTSGNRNCAFVNGTLQSNTTGRDNSAFGVFALRDNTTGGENSAFGANALLLSTTGEENCAFGDQAMAGFSGSITGAENAAFGINALEFINSGAKNSGFGAVALRSITEGINNSAFGAYALSSLETGDNNIGIGFQAGDNISTGNNNIIIGYNIDAPSGTGSNQLSIGNLIFGTGIDGTGTTISSGKVGIGNNDPDYLLEMESSGGGYYSAADHQWHNGSSRKIKQDIKSNEMDVLKILDNIEIVNYRYKTEVEQDKNAPYHVGFIGEDTPRLLSGKNQDSMATGDCIGLLLSVVKVQQQKIESLEETISKLAAKLR